MPRHKKKRRAANAAAGSVKKTDWLVGDLVVVKLRGHRPWPAQIQKPEDYGYDARPHRIFVTFFGTEETCFCSYNKITPFTSATRKSLAEQLQKINTNPELERAIKEIFAADDELKKSRDNSRHKEDEIGSEAGDGPPVERVRKRGRAVEEEGPNETAEKRSAKQEKTVKKMAAEQVHKLPRKVRIKVSTQPSDSSNNQQAGSGALPASEKASVSSSEALSREASPHRTSGSNEKVEVADAAGKKTVRATSVHDAVELADAPDKKTGRATSDQKSERNVKSEKEDAAAAAKNGVQNGDDANDKMDVDEETHEKEASAGPEDVEKMDVDDDQKEEDAKAVGKDSGNQRESDSIDQHGVEGLNEEDAKKTSSCTAEQSERADAPLPAVLKEGDSKSAKSMPSSDRDVSGDRADAKVDLEEDHRTAGVSVPNDKSEGSAVMAKALQSTTPPQMEDAEIKQGDGIYVAGSISTKQEDDYNEPQIAEQPVEKSLTLDPSTATVKDCPASTSEMDSKDSAAVQIGDTGSTLTKQDQDVPDASVVSKQQGLSVAQSEKTVGSDHQAATLEKQDGASESPVVANASGDDSTKTQVVDGDAEMSEAKENDSAKSQATDVTKGEDGDVENKHSIDKAQGGDDALKTQSTVVAGGKGVEAVKTQSADRSQEPDGAGLKIQQTDVTEAVVDEVATESTNGSQGVAGKAITESTDTALAVNEDSAKVQSTDEDSAKAYTTGKDSVMTEPNSEAGVVKDATGRSVSGKDATTESEGVAVSSKEVAITDSEQASMDSLKEPSSEKVGVQTPPMEGVSEGKVPVTPVKEAGAQKEEAVDASLKGADPSNDQVTVPPGKETPVADEKVPASTVQEASMADEKV